MGKKKAMSHGFYADGEGPYTGDSPYYSHAEGCACAGCWYEREQTAQDIRDDEKEMGAREGESHRDREREH